MTNFDQICRGSVISLLLVAHTEDTVLPMRSSDSRSGEFIWNQLPRVGIITRSNYFITVPAYSFSPYMKCCASFKSTGPEKKKKKKKKHDVHAHRRAKNNTLVQWKVKMYANVTFPLTLVSNKLNAPFSPCYFNGILELLIVYRRNCAKIVSSFGNGDSQDSHKNQYLGPVLHFGFTEPQYRGKCWSNLPLKCHIFTISNTHRRYCTTGAIIRFML